MTDNPFFDAWDTPFGAPPFDRIRPEHFPAGMKRCDAREQSLIQRDLRLMLGELWRVVAGNRFERVIGVARIEVEKNPAHPIEQTAATLERLDRIGKARGRSRAGDRRDLGIVLGHRPVKGRWEVLGTDTVERRHAERRVPNFKKRILGHLASSSGSGRSYGIARGRAQRRAVSGFAADIHNSR